MKPLPGDSTATATADYATIVASTRKIHYPMIDPPTKYIYHNTQSVVSSSSTSPLSSLDLTSTTHGERVSKAYTPPASQAPTFTATVMKSNYKAVMNDVEKDDRSPMTSTSSQMSLYTVKVPSLEDVWGTSVYHVINRTSSSSNEYISATPSPLSSIVVAIGLKCSGEGQLACDPSKEILTSPTYLECVFNKWIERQCPTGLVCLVEGDSACAWPNQLPISQSKKTLTQPKKLKVVKEGKVMDASTTDPATMTIHYEPLASHIIVPDVVPEAGILCSNEGQLACSSLPETDPHYYLECLYNIWMLRPCPMGLICLEGEGGSACGIKTL